MHGLLTPIWLQSLLFDAIVRPSLTYTSKTPLSQIYPKSGKENSLFPRKKRDRFGIDLGIGCTINQTQIWDNLEIGHTAISQSYPKSGITDKPGMWDTRDNLWERST